MTDDLQQMFDAENSGLPPVDPAFRFDVMARVVQRRFVLTLLSRAAAATLLALVLAVLWPAIETVVTDVGEVTSALNAPISTIATTLVLLGVMALAARWVSMKSGGL